MNAVLFGVIAVLLCSAAAAAIAAPAVRYAGAAYGGVVLLTAVLLICTGSVLLGVAVLVATAAMAAATYLLVNGEAERDRGLVDEGWHHSGRWSLDLPVACAVMLALVLTVGFAGRWHHGNLTASLTTLLHYRYSFVLGVLVLLAVVALASIAALGHIDPDERTHAQDRADKELRAERMARRRADRAAARQQRRERRREGS